MIKARSPCSAANEMKKRGPISASMVVYEDFLTYKSGKLAENDPLYQVPILIGWVYDIVTFPFAGIYQHVHGEVLGRLTVKLIGFNDTHVPKYWTAVNSWGPQWGENGTFKIVRGQSECLIESSLYSVWIN